MCAYGWDRLVASWWGKPGVSMNVRRGELEHHIPLATVVDLTPLESVRCRLTYTGEQVCSLFDWTYTCEDISLAVALPPNGEGLLSVNRGGWNRVMEKVDLRDLFTDSSVI